MVLADYSSRMEGKKEIFKMEVAVSKFALFEVSGCSSQFLYSNDFVKRKSKLVLKAA
jgi:hypothetical protein